MLEDDFLSDWPTLESIAAITSWKAVDVRGMTHLIPETPSEYITRQTAFTVGTAWLPDDRDFPAIVHIDDGEIQGVTIYENDERWVIRNSRRRLEWEFENDGLMCSSKSIDLNDPTLFPLRICTDLVERYSGRTLALKILKGGLPVAWTPE